VVDTRGDASRILRTVRARSLRLSTEVFVKLAELEEALTQMVHRAVEHGVENRVYGYMGLYRALYREFRRRYSWLPAPYAQEALRSASQVLKSWRELRRLGIAERPPRVERATVVCHPQCWRVDGFTAVKIAVRSAGRRGERV